jgi:polysaccharide deacetylase family protein (PEP-CTERM system associated)
MINALTIDVEDAHNVFARDRLGREGPPTEAVVRNTHRVLALLAEHGVKATFFVLGEVAAKYPQLVREVHSAGHELGSHGYYHRQVFKLTPETFRRETGDGKSRVEEIIGAAIQGYRAPAFSIMPQTSWALDILAELGFRYDSSIYPISGRRYGWPGFPLEIHEMKLLGGRRLIEAPLSTVCLFGQHLPACGGGYLRHFPAFVSIWAFRRIQRHRPVIVYLHPYEIEVGAPPPDTSHLASAEAARVRRFHALQLRNRETVEPKIKRLLERFQFAPLAKVIEEVTR